MSSLGPVAELIGFLFASALFFILILGFETAAVRVRALSPSVALARVTVLAAYVFIAWKAGFVRHDLHSLNAWHGLIIAAMTYALIAPRVPGVVNNRWWRDDGHGAIFAPRGHPLGHAQ